MRAAAKSAVVVATVTLLSLVLLYIVRAQSTDSRHPVAPPHRPSTKSATHDKHVTPQRVPSGEYRGSATVKVLFLTKTVTARVRISPSSPGSLSGTLDIAVGGAASMSCAAVPYTVDATNHIHVSDTCWANNFESNLQNISIAYYPASNVAHLFASKSLPVVGRKNLQMQLRPS